MRLVPGPVTKLAPFGAFVRLADGVEGLAHSSDLGNAALHMVNEGDIGQFRILSIDAQRRRIRLTPVEIYPPPDEDYGEHEMEGELAAVAESPDAEMVAESDDMGAEAVAESDELDGGSRCGVRRVGREAVAESDELDGEAVAESDELDGEAVAESDELDGKRCGVRRVGRGSRCGVRRSGCSNRYGIRRRECHNRGGRRDHAQFVSSGSPHTGGCRERQADKFRSAPKGSFYAQDEATRLHNYIGTEHLLLGLVREAKASRRRSSKNWALELNKFAARSSSSLDARAHESWATSR